MKYRLDNRLMSVPDLDDLLEAVSDLIWCAEEHGGCGCIGKVREAIAKITVEEEEQPRQHKQTRGLVPVRSILSGL